MRPRLGLLAHSKVEFEVILLEIGVEGGMSVAVALFSLPMEKEGMAKANLTWRKNPHPRGQHGP